MPSPITYSLQVPEEPGIWLQEPHVLEVFGVGLVCSRLATVGAVTSRDYWPEWAGQDLTGSVVNLSRWSHCEGWRGAGTGAKVGFPRKAVWETIRAFPLPIQRVPPHPTYFSAASLGGDLVS